MSSLDWVPKAFFCKQGHLHIQEARAFKDLIHRIHRNRRFVVLQDRKVNLAVEAKCRSSSLALNRMVTQTSMEIEACELYPRAYHTQTWSLRADAPSRGRQIDCAIHEALVDGSDISLHNIAGLIGSETGSYSHGVVIENVKRILTLSKSPDL